MSFNFVDFESQIYNWGIKRDASLDCAQPVKNDSSRDISSDASNYNIPKSMTNVKGEQSQKGVISQRGVAPFVSKDGGIKVIPHITEKDEMRIIGANKGIDEDAFVEGLWDGAENTTKNNVEKSQFESVENAKENGIINYTEDQQDGFDIDSLPEQVHHFATNKNKKYTPLFNEIVSRYGLDLDGDWNIEKMKHRGKHPYIYHDYILFKIKKCDMTANGDVDIFKNEFEIVKKKIIDNPLMLRKAFWKGKNYEILFDDV